MRNFANEMANIRTHLIISGNNDLLRINIRQILYIQSDGNYSIMFLSSGKMRQVTMQLGKIEQLIADQMPDGVNLFVRIGRGLIVNIAYIFYINPTKQQLILSDSLQMEHSLTASKDALASLKELLDKDLTLITK